MPRKRSGLICSTETCTNDGYSADNLCASCRNRKYRAEQVRQCSVPGCGKPLLARTYCSTHWQRWYRRNGEVGTADPLPHGNRGKGRPALQRLLESITFPEQMGGCWPTDKVQPNGYGIIWVNETQQRVLTHRFMYEEFIGPIPDGLVIDHLCRNPPCCNPSHLEPVTPAENIRRGKWGVLRYTTSWKNR